MTPGQPNFISKPLVPFARVMHSIRFAKVYYLAAFLLGAIIALLIAAPVRGADIPASADSTQRAAS